MNYFKASLLLFSLLLFLSCSEKKANHEILEETEHVNSFSVQFNDENISKIFKLEMKCLNKNSFSKDSFELISYSFLDIDTDLELAFTKHKSGYHFGQESIGFSQNLFFPKGSTSKVTSLNTTKMECENAYTEILRYSYEIPSDTIINHRYLKVFGYSNSVISNHAKYDWDYFFNSGDNLFSIYKKAINCNPDWKIKINE